MLLAVETSGMQGSIAIADGDRLITERILETEGHRHAQTLVSEVDRVLRDLGLHPSDIKTVAVSIGPGSFTGLRVGLVFAKTLAWLNQAQLVAVDSLQAIAQQVPSEIETVTALSDAQRGEFFAGNYRWDARSGCRQPTNTVHVSTIDALTTESPLVGPSLLNARAALQARHQLLDDSYCVPRASTVARIGFDMLQCGRLSVAETLEPVYVRLSYAEEKRR